MQLACLQTCLSRLDLKTVGLTADGLRHVSKNLHKERYWYSIYLRLYLTFEDDQLLCYASVYSVAVPALGDDVESAAQVVCDQSSAFSCVLY